MALKGASSTTVDQDWLDFKELAKEGPAVVFTVKRFEPVKDFGNGEVRPVIADVIILTGSRAGERHVEERVLAKGIRDKLTEVGDDVVGRLELYSRGNRQHPGLNAEKDGDLELAERALKKFGAVPEQRSNGSAAKPAEVEEEPPF